MHYLKRPANHLRIITVLSVFLFIQYAAAQDDNSSLDYETLAVSIDDISKRLKVVQAEVDQTRFIPEQWLDKLDYDAEEVLKAVSEQIAFQPYPGVLRGVSGTLRAGAGNSIDQALLLASLLKSAGYDARIARGTLSEADTERLLSNTGNTKLGNNINYLNSVINSSFKEAAIQQPEDINWKNTKLSQRSSTATDSLHKILTTAGVNLEPRDITGKMLAVSRDYFWVQHRDGASGAWEDAHPAFSHLPIPADLRVEEYFANSIPEKYHHTLTISAALNQNQAGTVTTHQLMKAYTRPIANLHGVPLSYRNHPNGLTLEGMNDVDKAISSSQFLMPTFNEAPAPGAMAFDLKGRVIDPMVISTGGAGVFATLSDRMEQATGSMQAPGESKSVFSLESMWLDFSFHSPDGTDVTYRRYILPPQSGEEKPTKELLWPLITDHSYMVNSGSQPWDYIANQYLSAGISANTWYKALMHNYLNPAEGTKMPDEQPPRDFDLLSQYQLMDDGPLSQPGITSYRAKPNLLGVRRGYRDAETAFLAIDVVANSIQHTNYSEGKMWLDLNAAMQRGVWDTSAETLPAQRMAYAEIKSLNTVNILTAAVEQNIKLVLIKPNQRTAIKTLPLNHASLISINHDLDNGYSVVVPEKLPQGESMTAWWRINLETGETLGMTADGYGQDATEYAIDMVNNAFTLVQAVSSLKACDDMKNDVAKMCCLVEANINNVAGLGIGGMIGSVAGAAGGALFSIVDYGMKAVTKKAFNKEQGLMPQAALGCHEMQATEW